MHTQRTPAATVAATETTGQEGYAVSMALAVIVRMADRLPQGTLARRALAEAAQPLRRQLGHID